MSKETWLAAYYPTAARDCPRQDALAHSLTKWRGLTREALLKHDLYNAPIPVGGGTCALCTHYLKNPNERMCATCPLAISRDGVPCDAHSTFHDGEEDSPWIAWGVRSNPNPMIKALEAANE